MLNCILDLTLFSFGEITQLFDPPFFLSHLNNKKLTVLRYSDGHLIFIWWSISNSKHEHYPSRRLADATKSTDMKP